MEEVLSEIKNLNYNKPTGPCSMSLKLFQKVLTESVSMIANIAFSLGTFPTILKIANVIPIFKKHDHTICNNYRPISF